MKSSVVCDSFLVDFLLIQAGDVVQLSKTKFHHKLQREWTLFNATRTTMEPKKDPTLRQMYLSIIRLT